MAWKVGELAKATGLTVRTLHHWDDLGLVAPSARTPSGHRLYSKTDIQRVYEVVALRELGLSLETIARVLADRGAGLGEVLKVHLSQVRDQLRAMHALESRLGVLAAAVRGRQAPDTADLLRLIEEVSTMSETFRNYFTDEQIAALQLRRTQLGEDYIESVENEWPGLIASVRAEMAAGTDPAAPEVQALAKRWMELLEAFDGGDADLRESNAQMLREHSEDIASQCGPSAAMIEYVTQANQARAQQ